MNYWAGGRKPLRGCSPVGCQRCASSLQKPFEENIPVLLFQGAAKINTAKTWRYGILAQRWGI